MQAVDERCRTKNRRKRIMPKCPGGPTITKDLTDGLGAHSVIETVGAQEATTQAIRSARPGGHVGFVGVSHGVQLPGQDLFDAEVHLLGGPAPVRRFLPELIDLVWNRTFNVTRLAIPHLKKSSAGSIIVISSLGGRFGYPNRSPYCTSKWGLIGFAKTLALELGECNIRANAIASGAVGGERIERILEGRAKAEGKTLEEGKGAAMSVQALKRFVDPKDIAALCIFLTSDAGKSISGQVLPIDNDSVKAS